MPSPVPCVSERSALMPRQASSVVRADTAAQQFSLVRAYSPYCVPSLLSCFSAAVPARALAPCVYTISGAVGLRTPPMAHPPSPQLLHFRLPDSPAPPPGAGPVLADAADGESKAAGRGAPRPATGTGVGWWGGCRRASRRGWRRRRRLSTKYRHREPHSETATGTKADPEAEAESWDRGKGRAATDTATETEASAAAGN